LHSQTNCGENCAKIYRLPLNLCVHYLAKFECSAVHRYNS